MDGGSQGGCELYVPKGRGPTALQRAVREGLSAFLAEADESGGLPSSLVRELVAATTCGDPARGFVLVECHDCGESVRVGFTCHGRTVCPACTARRAASTAVHLVEEVLPSCPYRQWTLTFHRGLKVALAADSALLAAAVRAFVTALFALQRRKARALGIEQPRPGAVAFVQLFTGALLLHPHAHVLVPEGVFCGDDSSFALLPPPTDDEVEALLRKVVKKVLKLAHARYPEGLPYAADAQAALAAASVQTRLPLGDVEPPHPRTGRRCAFLEGFSLHADTQVHENDRESLERLCRYGARGPVALDRLSFREDGKLEYRLKRPARGGATVLVLTPVQLLKRLCALMVKPKVHLTRYFGVFAPNAKARAQVVAQRPVRPTAPEAVQVEAASAQTSLPLGDAVLEEARRRPPRLDFADLLRRTLGVDLFRCDSCGGRRSIIAFVKSEEEARKALGLIPRAAAPRPRATSPPQLALALA
jgi:hypothetical protein